MTLHVSVTINWERTLIPSGFVGWGFVCLFVLFGVVCLWGLALLRGQGARVTGWKWEGFFSLKYVLLHLHLSFGFRVFRAICIFKTPPPNSSEEQRVGGEYSFTREDGISTSIMIFSLAKRKLIAKWYLDASGEQTELLPPRKGEWYIAKKTFPSGTVLSTPVQLRASA